LRKVLVMKIRRVVLARRRPPRSVLRRDRSDEFSFFVRIQLRGDSDAGLPT
jgi:hypothetical protein